MISFYDAKKQVLEQIQPVKEVEKVAVEESLGRVLAQPVRAPDNVPNHDNSAMDGYSFCHGDLNPSGNTVFKVVADLPAGDRLLQPIQKGEAVRIMTGAPIPDGCDCVIMQENVERQGDQLQIPEGQLSGQHIRLAGEDIPVGTEILASGRRLGPADLGLLTSVGLTEVMAFRRIRVALLSTGNEVVEAGTPLKPGQVYDSNRSALRAVLTALGGVEIIDLGLVRDDLDALERAFKKGGEEADAVISTGGVSVGDYDLVKKVLQKGGQIHFWKVGMKPGKPQAYGKLGGAHFFGLPGNPVSGLTVFLLIVRYALLKCMGASPEEEKQFQAIFRGTFKKRHNRMDFLRAVIHFDGEKPWVETTGPQGSGILTSLARANGFIVLSEEPVTLVDGDLVTVKLIDYV